MKKYWTILIFLFATTFSTIGFSSELFVDNNSSDALQDLINAITPKYEELNRSLSSKGVSNGDKHNRQIVQAYKVSVETYNGATAQIGYYIDGFIVTFISDPSGAFQPGTQIITLGTTPVSVSMDWVLETVNGITYVKHFHDTCWVYSTNFSQFAVF